MTDFELGIINACTEVFPTVQVRCCFFHLGQAVYHRVQAEGLQEAYNDATDLALAYVPVDDVPKVFNLLRDDSPDDLIPVLDYFERTYVIGVRNLRNRNRCASAWTP